ncbi:hypothetical protein Y1Q_0022980 [Alligator mississippiensis]|uniref:Uncharacterized protein n=1 Tax=Alligator mississippiensis TaxID=8496 RepID=A0A151P7L5_ALLMI|nr:hypothetical protein Y1Q_0022980 [Alligator mississippiensis]
MVARIGGGSPFKLTPGSRLGSRADIRLRNPQVAWIGGGNPLKLTPGSRLGSRADIRLRNPQGRIDQNHSCAAVNWLQEQERKRLQLKREFAESLTGFGYTEEKNAETSK